MTYVERHAILYVRLRDDGVLNVADFEYESVEGTVPSCGDYITQVDSDGFYYAIQIVERHRIFEPERNEQYWCLVFRDVEDNPHLDRLTACLRAIPK